MADALYRPIPILPVLADLSERRHRKLIVVWVVSSAVSLGFGLVASVYGLSGIPIQIGGLTTHITIYPPLIFSTLFCLWLGFWWGFIPAYVATFVLSQSAGMSFGWSLLFSFADPLGLAVLAITYRAAPISVDLRSFTSIGFYVFVTFVGALAGSTGSFIWSHTRGAEVEPFAIWEGWWVGAFLQGVFINGVVLRLAGARVSRWKAKLRDVKPWILPTAGELGTVFAVYMLCVMGFVLANINLERKSLESALAALADETALPELRQSVLQLTSFNWVTLALVAFSSFFGCVLALSWTRSLRESRQELQGARDVAEEANRAKSAFLANMSHELRTPLTSVMGFAQVLLENPKQNLSEDELLFARRIHANGKHLLSLINEVLDLSRIEAGKLELELEPVQLGELVPGVMAQVEGQARAKGLDMILDVPDQVAPVRADELRLRQVLLNIVGNAIKFTEKGSVNVRVVTDSGTARPAQIQVIDSGIGIPPGRQKDVFEAFEQVDSSASRTHRGAGLGLHISQRMAREMGFSLEVSSRKGQGSTFTIVLGDAKRTAGG
jgi:signal transduction histidine kinase